MSLLKDQRGDAHVVLIFFLFVFMIVTALTVEIYHIYTLKEHADTEISRALNIATDMAMLDEYRMSHISKIDMPTAKQEFNNYLHNEMCLNSNNERVENGKVVYKVIINDMTLENEPVKFEVKGVIRTRPVLLSKLVPVDIDIPFRIKARNQRYE